MKKIPKAQGIEARLNQLMKDYITLIFDISHLAEGRRAGLTRAISCNNHMLNVALAMAAAEGMSKELVTKALDLGEETARALIEKAMKDSGRRVTQ